MAVAATERAAAFAPQPVHAAEAPAYLSTPEPEYPLSAREDEQEGLVVLRVLVSRDGLPAEIRIARSSGFRALDAAAVAGVKRWTFSPATSDQRRIDAWMDVPVRFRLE
jgi:periplasmic protein TonB